ncbi:MAG TPA: TIM barrel protein [Acidobacteriota bacterium]|nr:TIM barrel protein [Acidobacteriota bacterium]
MRITEIQSAGLRHHTPAGGWTNKSWSIAVGGKAGALDHSSMSVLDSGRVIAMTAISRRSLLNMLPAILMASNARRGFPAPKKVIVGAHPWVYAANQPHNDITPILESIFEDMSYAGMDAIELMDNALRPEDSVSRIRDLSQKYRLPVLGTSYGANLWKREDHEAILKEITVVIERLSKLGGRTLGTSVGNAGSPKTPEQLDAQAEVLRRIIAISDDNGVVLNLHNHIYEVADNEHDLKGTIQRIPTVKLGPDLDWLRGAGVDPLDFIHRYGNRIVFAHLRDRKADGKWSEAMGEGNTDFASIGKSLHELNFSGDLVIELAHPAGLQLTRPLRDSLKMSRSFVRDVMGY